LKYLFQRDKGSRYFNRAPRHEGVLRECK